MVKSKFKFEEYKGYILPSSNQNFRKFVSDNKLDMMVHVISSIELAKLNDWSVVEVFQFKNSSFVITISEKEFLSNLDYIHEFCMDNEFYELCPYVMKVKKLLNTDNNEKEK